MSLYQATSTFVTAPYTQQADGEEVIIGLPEQGIFLALPPDAVELIDQLRNGKTLGEAEAFYIAKYGEVPDSEGLIQALEQRGFLRDAARAPVAKAPEAGEPRKAAPVRYHFAGFPQRLAQRIFGTWAFAVYGLLVALAIAAVCVEPTILPRWSSLVVSRNMTATVLVLMVLSYVMLFLHEMAHLIAARAVGVSCRMGIGHRLWILVAETDMTGVWAIPRRQRYLPFLAGPILDLVLAALLLLSLFASARGWVQLPPTGQWLLRASLIMLAFRMLWQFHFFLRTDFYCVFVTLFGCKNLMGDTEAFLKHSVRGLLRRPRQAGNPLDAVPPRERPVIRAYAGFWVVGRAVAFIVLFGIQLPVVFAYVRSVVGVLSSPGDHFHMLVDALMLSTLAVFTLGTGMFLWLRSLMRGRSARKSAASGLSPSVALE
ncbi:site-2 protease family protein [Myxococcus vastator]|uniref:site-2 protease family protein n=1 Tax=Myxococcus vastator TaxID=2709664 RepID=UPI0013D68506|nr:site-2 protease family protein [Myxococcus vastator]